VDDMETIKRINELTRIVTRSEVIIEDLARIVTDHESRVRWIERATSLVMGGGGLAYFLVQIYVTQMPK